VKKGILVSLGALVLLLGLCFFTYVKGEKAQELRDTNKVSVLNNDVKTYVALIGTNNDVLSASITEINKQIYAMNNSVFWKGMPPSQRASFNLSVKGIQDSITVMSNTVTSDKKVIEAYTNALKSK
jgi:hypothetical protein